MLGTLTRTGKDAACVLSIMAGRSELDKRTQNIPFDRIADFTTACKSKDSSILTIDIPQNSFNRDRYSPAMILFELVIAELSSAGATVIDNANFSAANKFKKINQQMKEIVRFSTSLKTFPGEGCPDNDIGKFMWTQEEAIDVDSDKYKEVVAQQLYFSGDGGITGAMNRLNLDVLIIPPAMRIL